MEDKIYIVTLYKHEDLEQFYSEMESNNYHLVMKRPMSRNTHYKMNEEQAEKLRQDPRVWDVQLPPEERGISIGRETTNYTTYNASGDFWKGFSAGLNDQNKQWGQLHCAGDVVQRAKNQWGLISEGGSYEQSTDAVDIFSNGKHVDVVICDDPVSIDCGEWDSPSTGTTRFKTYDWYTELNSLVTSIDDDFQSIPSAPYSNYFINTTNTESHGTHVAGTVAGQHYGWAREANIYSLQVLGNQAGTGTPVPDLLIFDYLRAFHQNKAINPATGIKNPTITNHSWGYGYSLDDILEKESLDLSDIIQIDYRGITYSSSNPNPSGWTWGGIEVDFGFAPNKMRLNADNAATNADIQDAISDGIVVVAAAGNNDFHCVSDGDPDYYNTVTISGVGTVFYNKGSSPGNSSAICVGALSNYADFRRSTYSNFGPNIDIFAPGNNILSAYDSSGILDTKYGSGNYYFPIQGTSMASPQVAGVLACLATGKDRFTNSIARKYLKDHSIFGDMTFDSNPGGASSTPTTYNITTTAPSASVYTLNGTDRLGSVSGNNAPVTIYVGDTVNFNLSNVSSIHPFYIRVSAGGANVSTPAATGQGSTGNNTVSWTPNTAGSFKYQCAVHPGMVGDIDVIQVTNTAGTFADPSCSKDSPNLYLHAKNPREGVTGLMSEPRGLRSTSGLTFPRVSTLNRSAPGTGQVITVSVTASGINAYIFNGSDRVNTFNDAANPTLNCNANDIIKFNVNVTGHPFLLKTALTPGDGDQIPIWVNGQNWDDGGSSGGGSTEGEILLFTFGMAGTTLYYVCQNHFDMSGSIIIS